MPEDVADPGQGEGRVIGREVEVDDVVGRVAVDRHLVRREGVRDHVDDVVGRGDRRHRLRRRGLELRLAGPERRRVEDDRDRGFGYAEPVVEQLLGPGRLEILPDEPAGPQRAARLRCQGNGGHEQDDPRPDEPPSPPCGVPPEPLEDGHGQREVEVSRRGRRIAEAS